MDTERIESFREKLEQEHQWPSLYTYKFIVPQGREAQIRAIFPNHEVSEKPSSQGNYISLTIKVMERSSESVIQNYLAAHKVEGVIAL